MTNKNLILAFLAISIFSMNIFASGTTVLPSMTISGILASDPQVTKDFKTCDLAVLIFATLLCGVRDAAEIKMNAENVVFNIPISESSNQRLLEVIYEVKNNIQEAKVKSDDEILNELASLIIL